MVRGAKGPEAGVWVIAETTDLPTKFVRIVATDDQGRYVIPDLPKASYRVWVRGYGLVDSSKVQGAPGRQVNLTAVSAPDARAAAAYYPSGYWFSLLRVPAKSEFPGTAERQRHRAGHGDPGAVASTVEVRRMHRMSRYGGPGDPRDSQELGTFPSSVAAWPGGCSQGKPERQWSTV